MGKGDQQTELPAQYKKLANLLGQNVPVSEAMVKAGWSEQQAPAGRKFTGVIKMLQKHSALDQPRQDNPRRRYAGAGSRALD